MKQVVRKITYDTETAEMLTQDTFSEFGDPEGYSETLYKTPEGYYFMHSAGGEKSKHPEEKIKPVSAANAQKMING